MAIHQALITDIYNSPAVLGNLEYLYGVADTSAPNVSYSNGDSSTITSNDLAIFLYMAEGGTTTTSGAGATFSLTVNSTTASVAVSNSNTAGNARVGIFYVQGSVVAGDSTTAASISSNDSNGFRSAILAYRLINGASASVFSTDFQEQSAARSDMDTTVDFSSGRLVSVGYFSDEEGHSFGTNQLSFESTALSNPNGSGNFGHNNTPGGSSYNVDFLYGGPFDGGNNQGDAMATAVFA